MSLATQEQPYDNWSVYHPEGRLMYYGSEHRAKWYLNRNLAKLIGPKSIQLTFVPNGAGNMQDPIMLIPRVNHCVVCGITERLTKHHVVPRRFRQFFPQELKEHQSHDVLVLCDADHTQFETHSSKELDNLIENANLFPQYVDVQQFLLKRSQLTAALGLLSVLSQPQVPTERKQAILQQQQWNITKLQEYREQINNELELGQRPKEMFTYTIQQAQQLEVICRQHFLKTMQPRNLPPQWDIHYTR